MTSVPLTATAKWLWSFAAVNARAAAVTPATSVPVTNQVGCPSEASPVAAISPTLPRSVRATSPTRIVELDRLTRSSPRTGRRRRFRRSGGDQLGGDDALDLTPGADHDGERVGSGPGSEHLVGGLDAGPVQCRADRSHAAWTSGRAVEQRRKLLAADPVGERLRVGADDRRDRVRRGPVVQVPPDVVALDGRRSPRRPATPGSR